MIAENSPPTQNPPDLLPLAKTALNPRESWNRRLAATLVLGQLLRVELPWKTRMELLMQVVGAEAAPVGLVVAPAVLQKALAESGPEVDMDSLWFIQEKQLLHLVQAASVERQRRLWGETGRPKSPHDSRLHLGTKKRPPKGTPRVAFVELLRAGCCYEEALEELRLQKAARDAYIDGIFDDPPGTCSLCGYGPGAFLPDGEIVGCESCGRRTRPC